MSNNICPYCKSELHPEAVKCSHCGEWLSPHGAPKSKAIYLLLAFLFGGIAEFYRRHFFAGILFVLLDAIFIGYIFAPGLGGGLRLSVAELAVIAGFIQLIYFIYACFVNVKPHHPVPRTNSK